MPRWASEDIPDDARLYLRVHRNNARSGLTPNIFVERGGGMSTDWSKYSTVEQTRQRGRKPAAEYGIVGLVAGVVRSVEGLSVVHSPDEETENQAHTDVVGLGEKGKQTNDRRALLFAAVNPTWLVQPEPEAPPAEAG